MSDDVGSDEWGEADRIDHLPFVGEVVESYQVKTDTGDQLHVGNRLDDEEWIVGPAVVNRQ